MNPYFFFKKKCSSLFNRVKQGLIGLLRKLQKFFQGPPFIMNDQAFNVSFSSDAGVHSVQHCSNINRRYKRDIHREALS